MNKEKKLKQELIRKIVEIKKNNPPGPFQEAAIAAAVERHNQKLQDLKKRREMACA